MDNIAIATIMMKLQKILSALTQEQQQRLSAPSEKLKDGLWQLLEPWVPHFKARLLSNVAYSLCMLPAAMQERYMPAVKDTLLPAFEQHLGHANAQDVSNFLYGIAKAAQQLDDKQVQQFVMQLKRNLTAADPQGIAITLWAVARMGKQVEEWQLNQLIDAFTDKLQHASPQDVGNILWACGELGSMPEQLLTAKAMLLLLPRFDASGLTQIAVICARYKFRNGRLFPALVQEVARRVKSMPYDVQLLTNVCWSVAALDLQQHKHDVLLMARACAQQWGASTHTAAQLTRLYQVHTWMLSWQGAGGRGLLGVLTEEQLQQCKESLGRSDPPATSTDVRQYNSQRQ